jgi:hypothetical protein
MSTAADFPPDTRIVSRANLTRKGTVIGKSSQGDQVVAVEWDSGDLARVNVADIRTEASLEDEFNEFRELVDAKLAEAASLIREAARMAESRGKDLQDYDSENDDYLFDYGQIEGAMRDAGWNTSSWHC